MTHYQKLATLIFRVIGLIVIAIGIVMILVAIVAAGLVDRRVGIAIGTIYGPPFLIFGWVVYSLSRMAAGWVTKDFDDEPVEGPARSDKPENEGAADA